MADTAPVTVRHRFRRAAESLVMLGLCLMAVSAVAWAEDPTPTPTPAPEATVVAVETPAPTPEPVATAVATAEATPVATATTAPTAVATATVTPTSTPTAVATATATPAVEPTPRPSRARQAPTPTPTPTPEPSDPSEFSGATMTVCHRDTADSPYETVVVDAGGQSQHFDHDHDLIPAPSGGCPAPGAPFDEGSEELLEVLVCHMGPDGEYTLESVERTNFKGHEFHKDDLIPAPNGTCPGLDVYGIPSVAPTAEPTRTPAPDETVEPDPTAEPTRTPAPDDRGDDDRDDRGEAAGSTGGGGGVSAPAAAAGDSSLQTLPFTGFDLWLLASAGLGLALAGAGLRLLAQPPVGVTR